MKTLRANDKDTVAAFETGKEATLEAYKDYYEPLERKLASGILKLEHFTECID